MRFKVKSNWKIILIIVFIFGMGSLYFQVLRAPLMSAMLLACSIVTIVFGKKKTIDKTNLLIACSITCFFLLNSVLNISNGFNQNDLIIWLCKVLFVVVLANYISFTEFIRLFTHAMAFEATLSLICFIIGDVYNASSLLPLLHVEQGANSSFILTPYFTLGWANILHRNAGIFLEPGIHQIPLNIALYYMFSDTKNRCGFKKKNYYIAVVILIVTILTTRSTTGYLSLGLILLATAFRGDFLKNKWKLQFFIIIILIALVIVESKTGVISDKIEGTRTGNGSGLTRFNDTFYGYYIALQRPLIGYGIFSTNMSLRFIQYGIENISNGMASYCCRVGIPAVAIFLYMMAKGIKRYLDLGWKSNLLFIIFLLICLNTEGVFMNLFMMIYFFKWREESLVVIME